MALSRPSVRQHGFANRCGQRRGARNDGNLMARANLAARPQARRGTERAGRMDSRVPEDSGRDAGELLAGPEPGPTPFAVDELMVDGAIGAVQGPPKVGKTWFVLVLALAACGKLDIFDELRA